MAMAISTDRIRTGHPAYMKQIKCKFRTDKFDKRNKLKFGLTKFLL